MAQLLWQLVSNALYFGPVTFLAILGAWLLLTGRFPSILPPENVRRPGCEAQSVSAELWQWSGSACATASAGKTDAAATMAELHDVGDRVGPHIGCLHLVANGGPGTAATRGR